MISVIVPVYNVLPYIAECIESIIAQSYTDMEIIIVDDGSTDGSGKICDDYSAQDDRIKVIHKKNGGLVSARKAGLEIARGSYIGFVDGDDCIEKNMYEILLDEIEDSDLIHSGYYENGIKCANFPKCTIEINSINRTKLINQMLGWNAEYIIAPSIWSKLFKTEIIKQSYSMVPDNQSYGEDLLALCLILFKANKIKLLDEAFYNYRVRANSLARGKEDAVSRELDLSIRLREIFKENNKYDCFKEGLEYFLMNHIMFGLRKTRNPFFVEQYGFPNIKMLYGKKTILYCAGDVGRDYYSQFSRDEKCNVVAWMDKNYRNINYEGISIQAPEDILNFEYDYIVVAVRRKGAYDKIKRELLYLGVDSSAIYWEEPIDYVM